jgi:type I restriction enzyme S subunit
MPPLQEQGETVKRVVSLFALAERLQERYEKARTQVDKMTQSVLAKAFRGELVTTEAELARREGPEYETAEELLARVQGKRDTPVDGVVRREKNRRSGGRV